MKRKRIAILGSTGSIGRSAVEVIEHLSATHQIVALSSNTRVDEMLAQAEQCGAAAIAIADDSLIGSARSKMNARQHRYELHAGSAGLCKLVERDDVDLVLSAIVGAAGLAPAFAAVRAGKTLALANKESLVVAGSLLIAEARKFGVTILPVDSEHSAIFQAMRAGSEKEIRRVILTASGGPFRGWSKDRMNAATKADALNHPTWQMGEKITVDCATMFNKALEIIEACWLFDLPAEKVQVVVHPESIVHSMVEFVDGSTIAQLSPPDMRTPIQYALTYPERADGIGRRMDWTKTVSMNFEPPDVEKFRAIKLAYEVVQMKGTSGAILNAANEVAVAAFLAERIRLGVIADVVERTIDAAKSSGRIVNDPNMETLLDADAWARATAESQLA